MSNFYFLNEMQADVRNPNKLSIFKKCGFKSEISDFAILLGGYYDSDFIGPWWLCSDSYNSSHYIIGGLGLITSEYNFVRFVGARPALKADFVMQNGIDCGISSQGIREVKYIDYPQTIENKYYSKTLEHAYKKGKIKTTGKKYTTDSVIFRDQYYERYGHFKNNVYANEYNNELTDNSPFFTPREHVEYEYKGQKYIRFIADENCKDKVLPDGRSCVLGEPYWVRVEPITWLIDEEANVALAKKIVFAGVPFKIQSADGLNAYNIYSFMDEHIGCFLDSYEENKPILLADDTKILLDKVDELIKTLPPKEKEIMLEQRKTLLQKYKVALEKKQRVDFKVIKNPINLTLEEDMDPEVALYTGLCNLVTSLTRQESLAKRIKQIDSYLELFESPITELPKETQTKEDMIRAVVFYSNKYHGYQGRNFKDKLQETLTSYKEQCEAELKKFNLEDANKPTLEQPYFDKDLTLLETIMDTLDKAVAYNENIGVFVDFISELELVLKTSTSKDVDHDSMAHIVSEAKVVIASLEERKKAELERELEEIVKQRIAKINEMLNSTEVIDPNNITEIEKEFAEDLQPFLVKLDKEAKRYVSLKNITEQIANSRRILQEEQKEENTPIGIIDSFVSDIHNSLLSEKVVPSDKEQTVNLVTASLNKFDTELDNMSPEQIKAINNFSYPIDEEHPLTVLQSSLAEISSLLMMHNYSQKGQTSQNSSIKK